jgi:hypothetical protein
MENNTSPAKSGLQYACLFGIIMILQFVVGYVLKINPQTNKGYGITINILNFFILPILFIYLACVNYKFKINNGFVTFGQCLKIGVSLCVIAALIASIFSSGFLYIFPEYFEETMRITKSAMLQQNPDITSEQLEMGISFARKFSNPVIAIPSTVAIYAFIGLIYSLIIGAIVKKEPTTSL